MDKKKLADMIKDIRKKKMEEQTGKTQTFNPVHVHPTHPGSVKDKSSPNDYVTRKQPTLEEIQMSTQLGPTRRRFRKNPRKINLGKLEARNTGGNQSMLRRYSEEKEVEIDSTDTNSKKSLKDKVTVNPDLPAMNGQLKQ